MKPLSIECPNLTCIINQSQPECVLLCALKSAREIITGFALALVLNPEVFDGETFVIDWCFVTVVTRQSYCHHPLSFHKNKNPTRSQN